MLERLADSKTFWLGVIAIFLGIVGPTFPVVGNLLTQLGAPDPATLISGGAVLVGIRDALKKIENAVGS